MRASPHAPPPSLLVWIGALVAPFLFVYTANKLHGMARLRGWTGSVRRVEVTVRDKAEINHACYVGWTDRGVRVGEPSTSKTSSSTAVSSRSSSSPRRSV